MRRSRRATALALSALVSAGGLTACGGGASTITSAAASSQTAARQRTLTALTHFAGCMRAHGIPVPDPNPQGQIVGDAQLRQQYRNTPQGHAAMNACRSYLQAAIPRLTAAQTQQYRHAQLLFARCMREHGVQLPDPDPTGEIHFNAPTVNKASPQFQRAASTCLYLVQSIRQLATGK